MLAPIIYMECTLKLLYEVDRAKLTHLKGQFIELENGNKYLKLIQMKLLNLINTKQIESNLKDKYLIGIVAADKSGVSKVMCKKRKIPFKYLSNLSKFLDLSIEETFKLLGEQ